jgi:hypothetical protein
MLWPSSQLFRIFEIAKEAFKRGRYVALPAPISDRVKAAPLGLQNPTEKRQIVAGGPLDIGPHSPARSRPERLRAGPFGALSPSGVRRCQDPPRFPGNKHRHAAGAEKLDDVRRQAHMQSSGKVGKPHEFPASIIPC